MAKQFVVPRSEWLFARFFVSALGLLDDGVTATNKSSGFVNS